MRTRSRAKKLEPRPCEICQELFQPYSFKQKICGKQECQREYDMIQAKKYYYKVKEREKDRNTYIDKGVHRDFEVTYTKQGEQWFWKAIGDNGSVLENGPFETRQQAKKDFQEATE